MTMTTDPKTNKTTYSDPKKTEEFADKLAQAMVEGLNKQVLEEQSIKVPFIGWIKFEKPENEPYGDYGVYLINPTNKTFNKVEMFSGMFEGDIEGLLESSKVVKNLGILKPYSSIKIGAIAWYDLDFVLWYHLDFYLNLNDKPECYCFDIMKIYAWKEEKIVELPILNIKGIPITLEPRDGEPITEEVKHTYLESRYTPNAE